MKTFTNPKQEKPTRFGFHKQIHNPMPPQFSRGSFENVRLAGTNVGASLLAGGDGSGESPGSCSINIYINNDVQGINNSVLVGSDVKMGDPGVSLSMRELKMDRGFRLVTGKQEMNIRIWWLFLLSFVVLMVSVNAYLLMS